MTKTFINETYTMRSSLLGPGHVQRDLNLRTAQQTLLLKRLVLYVHRQHKPKSKPQSSLVSYADSAGRYWVYLWLWLVKIISLEWCFSLEGVKTPLCTGKAQDICMGMTINRPAIFSSALSFSSAELLSPGFSVRLSVHAFVHPSVHKSKLEGFRYLLGKYLSIPPP